MSENIPKKVIDITGIELTPGVPDVCLGNGEQGFELCCDECDYFLLCFPEYDPLIEAKNVATGENNRTKKLSLKTQLFILSFLSSSVVLVIALIATALPNAVIEYKAYNTRAKLLKSLKKLTRSVRARNIGSDHRNVAHNVLFIKQGIGDYHTGRSIYKDIVVLLRERRKELLGSGARDKLGRVWGDSTRRDHIQPLIIGLLTAEFAVPVHILHARKQLGKSRHAI